MSVWGGYGLTGLGETIGLQLNRAQNRLQNDVSELSSGLRISSAASDPSGLAIAEGLQAKALGYDQAKSNVQDATNALTVADGALQTVTDILQRLRVLAIQANTDLASSTDRANLQTEADQLRHEIDSISQSTSFNGLGLLNGIDPYGTGVVSVGESTFSSPSVGDSYQNAPAGSSWTFSPASGSGTAGITAYSADNTYTKYNYPTAQPPSGASQVGFIQGQGTIAQTVSGFSAFDSYDITFNVAQRSYQYPNGNRGLESMHVEVGNVVLGTYEPTSANVSEQGWTSETSAVFVGGDTPSRTISFDGTSAGTDMLFIDDVQIHIVAERTPSDLGTTLGVQSGAVEGDSVACQLPIARTSYLGVSSMSLLSSASAAVAETDIGTALDTIGTARAKLGAQAVALQIQGTNDSTSFVNLTTSESAIRDLNVSAAATALTSDQILASIGTSILANVKTLASSVEKLFT